MDTDPLMKTDYDVLNIPGFYCSRSVRQYIQSWYGAFFYPKCNQAFQQRIQDRISLGGRVTSTCRCGTSKLICEDAPRMVSVCHCSICRYDEAKALGKDNAPAPFFAAVKRSSCRMEINLELSKNYKDAKLLVFRNSSDFARRGMCGICASYLVMDYEWFEPETIWLQNPVWTNPENDEDVKVEFAFNGGKADFDVCWPSRNDPCTSMTCKVSYLDKGAGEKRDVHTTRDNDDRVGRSLLSVSFALSTSPDVYL